MAEPLDLAKKLLVARNALARIANMADPDGMEEDEDGFTEWGCEHDDAVQMAYENCITIAQAALGMITEDGE